MRLKNFVLTLHEKHQEKNKSLEYRKCEALFKRLESMKTFSKLFSSSKNEDNNVPKKPGNFQESKKPKTKNHKLPVAKIPGNFPATPSSTIIVNYHHIRQKINSDLSFLQSATTLRKFNSCPFPKSDSLQMALVTGHPAQPSKTTTPPLDNFYQHYNLTQKQGQTSSVTQGSQPRPPPRNNSYPTLSPSKFAPMLNSIQEDLD